MRSPLWLLSPAFDLAAFLLPPLVSLAACAALAAAGALDQPVGPVPWLLAVVLVDVAHVYATAYRVYAEPAELRRRPVLYATVPLGCYAVGVALHAVSSLTFWRALAYLAVVHFVRQQAGWIALSRHRDGALPLRWRRIDRLLDDAAIYAGTLYPLLWWHAHLPRRFHWFLEGDFAGGLPPALVRALAPVYLALGLLWLLRQVHRALVGHGIHVGKALVMLGTWATWYVGIVALDSDLAFTLTNVLTHGVPYLLLVWRYRTARHEPDQPRTVRSFALFYAPLAVAALLEEGLWDRLLWHEHGMLFPLPSVEPSAAALTLLVPLLALPQATHYLLDAWIWRMAQNPGLARYLGLETPPSPAWPLQ